MQAPPIPRSLMRRSILFILLIACLQTAGQSKARSLSSLDSLAAAIDRAAPAYLFRNEEGELRPEGSSIVTGNDYTSFYFDAADSSLVKVTSEWATADVQRTFFYFYHRRLFLVRSFTYASGSPDQPVASGVYYFKGKRLIHKLEHGRALFRPEGYVRAADTYLRRAQTIIY